MVGSCEKIAIAPAPAAIAGGFVPVPLASLMAAWRACRSRPGGPGDFRAWLACREMLARRARIGLDRAPTYGEAELTGLLGISARRARASVRRLVAAGLLRWSELAIEFPEPPAGQPATAVEVLADSIGSGRGVLFIPRRLLRHLARGARSALLATALGALLRCLSRRRAGFDGRGRLKASWVARAFDVGSRAVKSARAELVALGWLAPEASGQAAMNRWGRPYRIDLAWARPGPIAGALSPPPPARSGALSPPPDLHQDPLSGMEKNQEPSCGGSLETGIESMNRCRGPIPADPMSAVSNPRTVAPAPEEALPSPRLDDIRAEDLVDIDRLDTLRKQAQARGLVGSSEADVLKFAAAAEHARSVGRRNPCGLFARIVAKGWWSFATLDEEERAARRLRDRAGTMDRSAWRPGPEPARATATSLGEVLGRLGIDMLRSGRSVADPLAVVIAGEAFVPATKPRSPGIGNAAGPGADRPAIAEAPEEAMLARLRRLIGRTSSAS